MSATATKGLDRVRIGWVVCGVRGGVACIMHSLPLAFCCSINNIIVNINLHRHCVVRVESDLGIVFALDISLLLLLSLWLLLLQRLHCQLLFYKMVIDFQSEIRNI